jgi:signal transduction histidine kinase
VIEPLRSGVWRLGLLYSAAAGLILLAFASLVWLNSAGRLNRELAAFIAEDVDSISRHLSEHGVNAARELVEERAAAGEGRTLLLLADPTWRVLAGTLPAWPEAAGREPGRRELAMGAHGGPGTTRAVIADLPGGYHLLVGREVTPILVIRRLFFLGLAGAAAAILLLGAVGAVLLRRVALARIEVLSRTAAAITQGDLRQRLPQRPRRGELELLATTINGMLDQIERLVDGVRHVSNALAHDLRTPMAELRARLEELLRARPPGEAVFEGIEAAIAEIDRVISIFNAILRLSEIEAGGRRAGFAAVELVRLLEDLVAFYEPLAEEKGLALTLATAPGPRLVGDRSLLFQAAGNLVDNALKYTPRGGHVALSIAVGAAGAVEIAVADDGPGMRAEERGKAVERFYRGDASRNTPGSGLGLSLVDAVARLHGGVLELADNHPGLRAILRFPPPQAA